MDFRSDTYQRARQELNSIENLDYNKASSYLKSKNIDIEEYREANKKYKSFLDSGKTIQPEGTRLEAIGDFIPDPIKDHVNRMFDPYMGEGLGSDISRGTADIGSFFVPGAQVLKVYKAGKALTGVKGATAIGKKAFKKRRIVRNAERGVATAAGFTISENSADENQYNAMLDIADELGGEGQSGLTKALKRFAVDENDSEAVQKINSFGLNLLAVPMFAGLAVIKNPLEKAKAIKKIADRAAKAKQQKLAIDVIPTTALGKAADKVGIRNLLFRGLGQQEVQIDLH